MSLRLVVSDICKSYNGKDVLKDCSFLFDSGGIYALMGPNGSGKSTFLRICALIENPDVGKIDYFSDGELYGRALINDINLRRRITLVQPKVGVFNTTVFRNAAYGLKIRGTGFNEIEKKVDKALEFVGLTRKKNHDARTLSSGESQRLGIARAMVIEPEVLFLDEPTASVDQENTEIIENIILDLKKEGRATIIIATHDLAQAERLADRVLIMSSGKIVEENNKAKRL